MYLFHQSIPAFIENLPFEAALLRPEGILAGIFLMLVLVSAFPKLGSLIGSWGTIIAYLTTIFLYIFSFYSLQAPISIFSGFLTQDRLSLFFRLIFSVCGLLTTFIYYAQRHEKESPVFSILILAVVLGLDLLVMTSHWAIVFLALETVSISSYILVSVEKQSIRAEAGIKYILFGATASAVMLYGITWQYGITHSLFITEFTASSPISISVFVLILSGLFFKIAAFPFHFWAPDVYQGTPEHLLPFLSYAPKIGAFVVLIKITQPGLLMESNLILPMLAIAAIGSLMIGNWGAMRQDNSLRLMAYSGIAQTGFVLTGICCGVLGIEATLFYLAIYLCMNFSVFYLLYLIGKKKESFSIKGLQGFGQNNPLLGVALLIGLVALAGLPPTVGFQGKLLIFSAIYDSYMQTSNPIFLILLTASGLFTLTSFYFYLKIPYYIFVKRNETNPPISLFFSEKLLLIVLTMPLLLLFFMPQKLNNLVKLINLVY